MSDIEFWTEEYLEKQSDYGDEESSVIAKGIRDRWTTNQLLEELDTDEEGLGFMLSSFNDKWKDFCIDEAIYALELHSSGFSLESIGSIDRSDCWESGLSFSYR